MAEKAPDQYVSAVDEVMPAWSGVGNRCAVPHESSSSVQSALPAVCACLASKSTDFCCANAARETTRIREKTRALRENLVIHPPSIQVVGRAILMDMHTSSTTKACAAGVNYDRGMKNGEHSYRSHLTWDGNRGDGTANYETYGREHRIEVAGKPVIHATADAAFRGDASQLNPEDLFLAAIASCHMLSYLALCAKYRVNVLAYEDEATGTMQEDGRGGGKFVEVTMHRGVA